MEIISKIIEANTQATEGATDDSFFMDKERLERGKSLKMDTTIMSEMEQINLIPDSDRMEIEDEASFL